MKICHILGGITIKPLVGAVGAPPPCKLGLIYFPFLFPCWNDKKNISLNISFLLPSIFLPLYLPFFSFFQYSFLSFLYDFISGYFFTLLSSFLSFLLTMAAGLSGVHEKKS